MSLTYVYAVSPPTGAAVTAAGKVYNPNSAGMITGVAAADALTLQGVAGASLKLLLATGLTADRPQPQPATALTGAGSQFVESSGGLSPPGAPRSVREPLDFEGLRRRRPRSIPKD